MEGDIAEQLERVTRLHVDGALSDAEFEKAKARILGGAADDGNEGSSKLAKNVLPPSFEPMSHNERGCHTV